MLRLQAPLPDDYTLATDDELVARIAAAKATLGDRLVILGHHYQRDEVIRWADAVGDSFKLARFAADNHQATDIVFCGVHFMAESADVLTGDHQRVILPDLNAGCSMADMADIDQVEEAWDEIARDHRDRPGRPDHLHELGRRAEGVRRPPRRRGVHVVERPGRARVGARQRATRSCSSPTSTSAATPASTMGYGEADMRVWNPHHDCGGLEERDVKDSTLLLWKGHCSVHQRFRPEHVGGGPRRAPRRRGDRAPRVRARRRGGRRPGRLDRAHPGVGRGRARRARRSRSPPRSTWCSASPASTPTRRSFSLDPLICPCATMFRIDAPHLAWTLEHLVAGRVVNQIVVDPDDAEWARVALQRMLDIT